MYNKFPIVCRGQNKIIGLCSVEVIVNRPNGICVKSKEVIHTLFIPVSSMDQNGKNNPDCA